MEQLELEGIAAAALREGGQEDDAPPKLGRLAAALLGDGAVEYALLRTDGELVRIHDRWRIYVRRGLPVERRAFTIAHELGEWWLRVRERYVGADVEDAANYIGAAILGPRRAFGRAMAIYGDDFAELASAFRVTETLAALRGAEISRRPRAVVSPALVRVRGPDAWVWPDAAIVRRWARIPAPGVTKVRLTDDPRRVVLDVAEA